MLVRFFKKIATARFILIKFLPLVYVELREVIELIKLNKTFRKDCNRRTFTRLSFNSS